MSQKQECSFYLLITLEVVSKLAYFYKENIQKIAMVINSSLTLIITHIYLVKGLHKHVPSLRRRGWGWFHKRIGTKVNILQDTF